MREYSFYDGARWKEGSLKDVVKIAGEDRIWSARISTGIFGLPSCSSGNRGPKSGQEVLLGIGNEGLQEIVSLGFVTCPVCHPENEEKDFLGIVKGIVRYCYDFENPADFLDRKKVPFDARRLDWEKIANIAWGLPSRIYVPEKLAREEVEQFANRLKNIQSSSLNSSIPPIGFYDRNSPTRFTAYDLS